MPHARFSRGRLHLRPRVSSHTVVARNVMRNGGRYLKQSFRGLNYVAEQQEVQPVLVHVSGAPPCLQSGRACMYISICMAFKIRRVHDDCVACSPLVETNALAAALAPLLPDAATEAYRRHLAAQSAVSGSACNSSGAISAWHSDILSRGKCSVFCWDRTHGIACSGGLGERAMLSLHPALFPS